MEDLEFRFKIPKHLWAAVIAYNLPRLREEEMLTFECMICHKRDKDNSKRFLSLEGLIQHLADEHGVVFSEKEILLTVKEKIKGVLLCGTPQQLDARYCPRCGMLNLPDEEWCEGCGGNMRGAVGVIFDRDDGFTDSH